MLICSGCAGPARSTTLILPPGNGLTDARQRVLFPDAPTCRKAPAAQRPSGRPIGMQRQPTCKARIILATIRHAKGILAHVRRLVIAWRARPDQPPARSSQVDEIFALPLHNRTYNHLPGRSRRRGAQRRASTPSYRGHVIFTTNNNPSRGGRVRPDTAIHRAVHSANACCARACPRYGQQGGYPTRTSDAPRRTHASFRPPRRGIRVGPCVRQDCPPRLAVAGNAALAAAARRNMDIAEIETGNGPARP